jgi:hypothetical protein
MAYNLVTETNRVLELLSLPLVDDTTINTDREAVIVTRKLDEVRLELQAETWNFNTSKKELIPDVNKHIYLSSFLSFRGKQDRYRFVDNKLYDTIEKTDEFDEPVTLEVVETVDIEECPIWFINLVTAQTAWELRATLGGNIQDTLSSLQDNWIRKKAIAVQANIDEMELNYGNYLYKENDCGRWNFYLTNI